MQVEETVCGVARRHGLAQSLLFTRRRRQGAPGLPRRRGRTGSYSCRDRFRAAGPGVDVRVRNRLRLRDRVQRPE
ncbi:hypothetical protein [Bradyrhizobium sp. 26S5]|uniref:hypothetical protein n=1 Tax=Bradyrhizobium sp. 26S5 TaxID=3139729 RepID=UPI0039C87BCF